MASMIHGQAQEMPATPPAQRNTPTGQPTRPTILSIRSKMPLLTELENLFRLVLQIFRAHGAAGGKFNAPASHTHRAGCFNREPHEIPEPDKFPFRVLGIFRG
jgi:hypothetical protein